MTRWILYLCILLVVMIIRRVSAGNCTDPESISMRGDSMEVVISGLSAKTQALKPDNSPAGAHVFWKLTYLVEREKNYTRQLEGKQGCNFPKMKVDPLSPFDPVPPHDVYPPRITTIDANDLNCQFEKVEKEIVYEHYEQSRVTVKYSHPAYPDFQFAAHFVIVNDTFSPVIPCNTTYLGYPLIFNYTANQFKVSYDFIQPPFGQQGDVVPQNSTFWSIHWDAGIYVTEEGILKVSNQDAFVLGFEGNQTSLVLGLEKAFVVDDYGFAGNLEADFDSEVKVIASPQEPFDLGFAVGVALCNEWIAHWDNASYDPYFAALFNGGNPVGKSSSSSSTLRIAMIAVFVPVFGGLLIFIALMLFVPAARSKVFTSDPFSKKTSSSPPPEVTIKSPEETRTPGELNRPSRKPDGWASTNPSGRVSNAL